MSNELILRIEVLLPDWYVQKYHPSYQVVGQYEVIIPDETDDNVDAVVQATLGNMCGGIQEFMRAAEDQAR